MARNKVQDALRQRKRSEAEAAMANGPPEEGAYQCFFNRDDLPLLWRVERFVIFRWPS